MELIKKIKLTILGGIILLSFGCENENCYSCDDEVESWVSLKIKEIPTMSRKEIISYDEPKQKGIYNALTPERRKYIWEKKFEAIKELEWTKKELIHLQSLDSLLIKIDFNESLSNNNLEYFDKWATYGVEELGWTRYFITSGFMKLGKIAKTKEEFSKTYLSNIKKKEKDVSINLKEIMAINVANAESCSCRDSYWDDSCQGGYDCEDNDCDSSFVGCGLLWLSSCNGVCKDIYDQSNY